MKREREELRATLSKFMGPNENEYGVVYIINVDEHIMIFYYYYYFFIFISSRINFCLNQHVNVSVMDNSASH